MSRRYQPLAFVDVLRKVAAEGIHDLVHEAYDSYDPTFAEYARADSLVVGRDGTAMLISVTYGETDAVRAMLEEET